MGRHGRDTGDWWRRDDGWLVLAGLIALTQVAHHHGIYPSTSPHDQP